MKKYVTNMPSSSLLERQIIEKKSLPPPKKGQGKFVEALYVSLLSGDLTFCIITIYIYSSFTVF